MAFLGRAFSNDKRHAKHVALPVITVELANFTIHLITQVGWAGLREVQCTTLESFGTSKTVLVDSNSSPECSSQLGLSCPNRAEK